MGFEEFHFLRPWWLAAMVPLAVLIWLWVRRHRTGSGWETSIDPGLLAVLLQDNQRQAGRWLGLLVALGLALACLGLAGPTWQKLPQNVEQKQDTLIILLDLSLSMLAEDEQPSRVERARQEITDILRTRQEGQTALIAYAGDAHAVVPLTDDVATIENLLFSLGPEIMPVAGSNPGHGLELAEELFTNARTLQGRLLLVTDGVDDISSVTRHADPSFPISVLGIGTPGGGAIPLDRFNQRGQFLRTQEGNQVIAQLDEQRLDEVARLSHGRYARAVVGDTDINYALGTPLPGEDETIEVEREFDTWFDQGHWVTLLLIPLLLYSFRRGVLIGVGALALLPADPVYAAPPAEAPPSAFATGLSEAWASLWLRDDQRGHQKLRRGQPEQAVPLFEDHADWQAVARYRSGEYATALRGFTSDPSVTGLYNSGNSLARLGEYEAAIAAYAEALEREPGHADAEFNKALVERLLEEQQAAQEQNQDQESQANNEDSETQQNQQEQQQDGSENQDPGEDAEERRQQEEQQAQQEQQEGQEQQLAEVQEDEATRDEKQEALEQWLRRVPDDPGGLLRRKFSHETRQRLRRGDYDNRRQEKIW